MLFVTYLSLSRIGISRKRMLPGFVKHITILFLLIFEWCPEPDLNRHDRNDRGILSPLCLPISPPGQSADLAGAKDTMQAENPKRRRANGRVFSAHACALWRTIPSTIKKGAALGFTTGRISISHGVHSRGGGLRRWSGQYLGLSYASR